MNTISKGLIILAVALTAISCACENNDTKHTKEVTKAKPTSEVMDVDTALANAGDLVGKEITLEGICTHICKHAGRKIFLMGDNNSIRIEGGKVGKFEQKCVNSIVAVTGIVMEERIDESYLQNWEVQIAAQKKEVHGDEEEGCDAEKQARKEKGNTTVERIANFRKQISKSKKDTGKEYLSFYHISANSYEVK